MIGEASGKAGLKGAAAGKLTAAIQAVPLMELARDLAGRVGAAAVVPTYRVLSGHGCAIAEPADRDAMADRTAMVRTQRTTMLAEQTKWAKRITSVNGFVGGFGAMK